MTIRRRRGQRRSRLTRMRQRLNIAAQLQSTIDAAKIKEIKDKGRPEDWRSIQGLGLGGIGSRKQGFPCPSPVVFYKLINLSSIRPSSLPQITALLSLSACKMSVTDVLKRKSGVIVGDDVLNLFNYAQEKGFAIPAINVTSSSTVVAALEAARDAKSPIILQMSQGGAAYFAGKVSSLVHLLMLYQS
ncbi:uncharacterized protein V2V93DRAFT_47195 [Kockiozyma suomiensis]|uniref:uncharacterized protein n=1 Tax=Kockiozyma suomiensis TaxID=1337062 RepID=UPI003343FF1E